MRTTAKYVAFIAGLFVIGGSSKATPSTTYWTPATTDIQGYQVLHLGIDDYFSFNKKSSDTVSSLPTDVGLTLGVLPFEKVQAEIGVDFLGGVDDPFYFNGKIGTPEGSLFGGSPALNVGIFNVGTQKGVTDYNIAHVMLGKTVPCSFIGPTRLFLGAYRGDEDTLVDGDGGKENEGWMVGMDHGFMSVKDKNGDEYNRWVLAADYASGENAIGGGGVGIYCFFTKNISLLTGPVWFNEDKINGDTKWTTQLDINIPF